MYRCRPKLVLAGHPRSQGMSSHNSSSIHSVSSCYLMTQAEYRKLQKHSDNRTLLVTIPTAFAQVILLMKLDVVKMTLVDGKRIVLERA